MKTILITLCIMGLFLSLPAKSDTSSNGNQSKVVKNAGLRSDGELVQGKARNNQFKQNAPRTHQQQGRVLTDSDTNEAKRQGHTIHLQNATVSSIKSESLNNKRDEKQKSLKK